jgi:hypothetical protein
MVKKVILFQKGLYVDGFVLMFVLPKSVSAV